jgi:hypothetical protein
MRGLFSNNNSEDGNEFFLLMNYHVSKKGGFARELSVEEANKMLKKVNENYRLKE